MKKSIILFLWLGICHLLQGQIQQTPKTEDPTSMILFVFDASYSMMGHWGAERKITIAQQTLIQIIDSLEKMPNVKMALRVYGHQSPVPPQDCKDTKLEVAFGNNNAAAIRQKLRFLTPRGTTPLAYALEQTEKDFPATCKNCRNIVILITDGLEECGGDPCEVSLRLQKQGIFLKPFIIGIGIDENFRRSFDCIGRYYNSTNKEQFNEVLKIVITQALNTTSAQVNLLDQNNKPTETDVNMTFYDLHSGKMKYNYIHTLNSYGVPDTITLDPLISYSMQINTIPPVFLDSIRLIEGKHTIIAAKTPQGTLIVKTTAGNQYRGIKFAVRKSGDNTIINFQNLNEETKYITGKYDVDIPTLPTLHLKNVDIKQSHTTTIEIPMPGIINMVTSAPGYGSIYVMEKGESRWVCNLNPEVKNDAITLLPGKYFVVFRPKNTRDTNYSVTRYFEIKSGTATTVNIN